VKFIFEIVSETKEEKEGTEVRNPVGYSYIFKKGIYVLRI
jgi:hypothetical protein